MNLTKENYFEVKQDENGVPVLSNSMLKMATMMSGGNEYHLESYYEDQLTKEVTPSMALGSLLHGYVEDPSRYVFQPDWELSQSVRNVVDELHNRMQDEDMSDSLEPYGEAIANIASEQGYGKAWKPETVVKKIREQATAYHIFKLESADKIAVTGEMLTRMQGMIASLESSVIGMPVLHDPTDYDEFYRELPISFYVDGQYPFKALIDMLEVNHALGVAHIYDLKTTSSKLNHFLGRYTYTFNGDIPVRTPMQGEYVKWSYFLQQYVYTMAVRHWLEQQGYESKRYDINFSFMVIENSPPYECGEVSPGNLWNDIAEKEFSYAFQEVHNWFNRKKYLDF